MLKTSPIAVLLIVVSLNAIVSSAQSAGFSNQQTSGETYSIVLEVGTTQQFRLAYNPTTGTEWWLESVSSNHLTVALAGTEAGTLTCPPPQVVGCGQRFDVFSITSDDAGQYTAEFRLGHPWNHAEYYQTVFLNVQVVAAIGTTDSTSTRSSAFPPFKEFLETVWPYVALVFVVVVLAVLLARRLRSV